MLENSTIIGHNISLKIVHQINSNQPDSLMNNNKKSITRNENNTRTYHNTIEKRSRSSINERIHQLKEIVAASDGKVGREEFRRKKEDLL